MKHNQPTCQLFTVPATYDAMSEAARDTAAEVLWFLADGQPSNLIAEWCELPERTVNRLEADHLAAMCGEVEAISLNGPPFLPTPAEIQSMLVKFTRIHQRKNRLLELRLRQAEYEPRRTTLSHADIAAMFRQMAEEAE